MTPYKEDELIRKVKELQQEWAKCKKHYGPPTMAEIQGLLDKLKAEEQPRLIIGEEQYEI